MRGSVRVESDIKLGYDTFGASQFTASGDLADLANGLYISDRENADGTGEDTPLLALDAALKLGLAAGVDVADLVDLSGLGIDSAGIEAEVAGGLEGDLEFDLTDPDGDGRLRGNELFGGGSCLELQGEIAMTAEATLTVGFFQEEFPFAREPLVSANEVIACEAVTETAFDFQLARLVDDELQLLVGDLASERSILPDEVNESYRVSVEGEDVVVSAFGVQQVFSIFQVGRITAFAADGNDSIILDASILVAAELDGGGGNDTLQGGSGDDVLSAGDGDDLLRGGDGFDTLVLEAGNNTAYGEGHDDTILGSPLRDEIFGGSGNDTIEGNDGDDVLHGDSGHDTIQGGAGDDYIDGGDGDDQLFGHDGADSMYGRDGRDRIEGGNGENYLVGGSNDDTLIGGDAIDVIHGEAGDDSLWGGGGNDVLLGGSGKDELIGGDAEDHLEGGPGDDQLSGGNDNDMLFGGSGDDFLWAGFAAADSADGGSGDDRLIGTLDPAANRDPALSTGQERAGDWRPLSGSADRGGLTEVGGVEQAVYSDHEHGVYVAWVDFRSGVSDVYVAHHPPGIGEWT